MSSRTLQAYVLGLVVLATSAMAAAVGRADPAYTNKWESKDGKIIFECIDTKKGTWTLRRPGKPNDTYQDVGRGSGVLNLSRKTDEKIKGGTELWALDAKKAIHNFYTPDRQKVVFHEEIPGSWK